MTKARRWSERLERQRAGAETAATHSADRTRAMIRDLGLLADLIYTNPAAAEKLVLKVAAQASQILAEQEQIRYLMLEARTEGP